MLISAATGVVWGGGADWETRAHDEDEDEDESDSTFRCGGLGWADLISAAAGTLAELPLTLDFPDPGSACGTNSSNLAKNLGKVFRICLQRVMRFQGDRQVLASLPAWICIPTVSWNTRHLPKGGKLPAPACMHRFNWRNGIVVTRCHLHIWMIKIWRPNSLDLKQTTLFSVWTGSWHTRNLLWASSTI